MPGRARSAITRILVVALLASIPALIPSPASARVLVSRAQVDSGNLRIEGTAVRDRAITVDGVAMGRSTSSGSFRISRSGYTAPADCTVDVDDGSATATTNVGLDGCTVTATPAPATMLPDTAAPGPFQVGVQPSTTVVSLAGIGGPHRLADHRRRAAGRPVPGRPRHRLVGPPPPA